MRRVTVDVPQTLELWRVFDLEALAQNASREVAARAAELRPRLPAGVVLLSAEARAQLRRLAAAGLSDLEYDRILQAVSAALDAPVYRCSELAIERVLRNVCVACSWKRT